MNSTVIAVDLAKDVFEIAVANRAGKIQERLRLNRPQFHKLLIQREPADTPDTFITRTVEEN
jgi:hypothetical protein